MNCNTCNTSCDWFINAPEYQNCSWVACQYPHSTKEVADMMGLSPEMIKLIEREALRKLRELSDPRGEK